MKNFLILPLLGFSLSLFGQSDWQCATPSPRMTQGRVASQLDYIRPRTDTSTLFIPITITIMGEDNGTGYYPVAQVWDALCELEADFAPHGIQFYIQGLPRYIAHSLMYDMDPGFFYSDSMFNFVAAHNVPNTLNIYVIDSYGPGLTTFRDLDYDNSTYPPTIKHPQKHGILIAKNQLGDKDHILTHEVGHYLGLWHTFAGWEGLEYQDYAGAVPDTLFWATYDPDEDTIYYNLPWLVEYVDRSNCAISGDLICDTEPDYLSKGWICNANGESGTMQADPQGDTFRSDGTNYMSYSNDACVNHFSPQQVMMMRDVAQGPRSYLLYGQVPTGPLTGEQVTWVYPAEEATVEVNDSIVLDWESVAGADYYLVEFGRKVSASFTYPILSEVSLTESELKVPVEPNRTYYLKVNAISRYHPCQVLTDASLFYTASPTATEEIVYSNGITLYPNPVSKEVYWKFHEGNAEHNDLQIHIFDALGRQVRHTMIGNGSAVNVADLAQGMYSLLMIGDTQTYFGKFIKSAN